MTDELAHQRKVEKLTARRLKGANAEVTLKHLDTAFMAQREEYFRELVDKTRTDGEVYDAAVFKLVALNDIVDTLTQQVKAGRDAEKQLKTLERPNDG